MPHSQRVAICALATTMVAAIEPISTHQKHCNRWILYFHTIFMVATHGHSIATLIILVAIGETLYCHPKYLAAIGGNSIATLNIVVAIGGALCCHDKCLVARGCRSIATTNVWLL